MRIFLDVCCLSRLFDEQTQPRIRMETKAVQEILQDCQGKNLTLITGDFLEAEIRQNPNIEMQKLVLGILALAKVKVKNSKSLRQRIRELKQLGFTAYDASHIASAEWGKADAFLSTDDKLVKRAQRNQDRINVMVENPCVWLLNIHNHDDNA